MYKILKFERARECLKFLIEQYNIKEIYIPYYLCDVIRHTLFQTNCKPLFYHINDDFMPEIDFPKNAFILYPNYFGIFGKNVKALLNRDPNLIVDNAHAYYEAPSGFASFNSGIKFGYDNAYLWIKGSKNNDISPIINPEWQKERLENFFKLDKIYSEQNLLDIKGIISTEINSEKFCPFCYPLLAESEEKANSIVKSLQGYTIYRYWNQLPKSYNEYKFYSRLVPIPV